MHRRYDLARLKPESIHSAPDTRKTIAYARVSSRDQKKDLERQKEALELYCAAQGWAFELVSDLGSGMNYYKKGLKRLLEEELAKDVLEIITVFSARLYGSRSRKNQKLIEGMKKAVGDVASTSNRVKAKQ